METVIKICLGLLFIIGVALLLSFPVMWLWNELMPKIFGLVEISVKEALYLMILSQLLFTSNNSNNK